MALRHVVPSVLTKDEESASIMRNVLERIPEVKKLVQVGIRDVCEEEMEFTARQGERACVFYDRDLIAKKYEGIAWGQIAREIVAQLPGKVWETAMMTSARVAVTHRPSRGLRSMMVAKPIAEGRASGA